MQDIHHKIARQCSWGMNKKRTYIKCGIWHLGGRKRERRGFLLFLGTLARSILMSVVDSVSSKLLEGVGKKNVGEWDVTKSGQKTKKAKICLETISFWGG